MPRAPGKKYPSDKRRWFRVAGTVGTDTAALSDAEFRAYILITAEANERRAQDTNDMIVVARSRLADLIPNRRHSNATAARVLHELSAKLAWDVRERGATVTIWLRNYSETQGFTPTQPQLFPNEAPATTPTPTPTPKEVPRSESSIRISRRGGSLKNNIAKLLRGREKEITAKDPTPLVRFLEERASVPAPDVWAAIVQSRDKPNPPAYLAKLLNDPAFPLADSARAQAKREMKESDYL